MLGATSAERQLYTRSGNILAFSGQTNIKWSNLKRGALPPLPVAEAPPARGATASPCLGGGEEGGWGGGRGGAADVATAGGAGGPLQ